MGLSVDQRAAVVLFVALLCSAWGLWCLCDGLDRLPAPGGVALVVVGAAVLFASVYASDAVCAGRG